jgi:dihydroorotase
MKTLIYNAKTLGKYLGLKEDLVDACILIENGLIKDVLTTKPEVDGEVEMIDAKGNLVVPGLIDPQVHFREPGLEYKEDIESGSKAANKGGFTTVISMPNTTPTADNAETIKFMWNKQQDVSLCRVYPTGAVTLGLKGRALSPFEELKNAGAIALTDDGKGIQSDLLFEQAMIEAAKLDMSILDHSEDESLSNGGAIHLGEYSKKHGVAGIDSRSESAHVERGCRLSGKTGCHYHVLHISTIESIEHVKDAKKKGYRVTAEVSPHHLLLCDEDIPLRSDGTLDSNWKMNPPLRSKEDRAACVAALIDGTIDAIATDHAPHAPQEKAADIHKAPFGIIGLETAFGLCYTHFVKTNKITLEHLVNLMTEGPAKLFKLDLGKIEVGAVADLTIIDLSSSEEVTDNFFASKSKNSPFIGQNLYGIPQMTFLGGNLVYAKDNA